MIVLYNTITETLATQKQFPNGYPDYLPDHIIQLEVINTPMPAYDHTTHKATMTAYQRVGDTWVNGWVVEPLTEYELAVRDWADLSSAMRIVAPIQLVLDDFGNKMETWFRITDLHIEKKDGMIRVYCSKILDEHQAIYDQFVGVITVEQRPEILNPEI